MIEERAPVAKEKAMTPMIINKQQIIFSSMLCDVMSPYPTVMMVVTTK